MCRIRCAKIQKKERGAEVPPQRQRSKHPTPTFPAMSQAGPEQVLWSTRPASEIYSKEACSRHSTLCPRQRLQRLGTIWCRTANTFQEGGAAAAGSGKDHPALHHPGQESRTGSTTIRVTPYPPPTKYSPTPGCRKKTNTARLQRGGQGTLQRRTASPVKEGGCRQREADPGAAPSSFKSRGPALSPAATRLVPPPNKGLTFPGPWQEGKRGPAAAKWAGDTPAPHSEQGRTSAATGIHPGFFETAGTTPHVTHRHHDYGVAGILRHLERNAFPTNVQAKITLGRGARPAELGKWKQDSPRF
ncbi:hypothetical protein NDU88_000822 [Pleurodeles waltl]|uniref:Uncharacterized protein n=1 Tax=Pleurodeles waltl TaxID=8319 RepID=A0AAV7VV70_PLEWA|nr:hypothetical protein NDU88_000822 [Pleurodeles waltl]